MKTKLVSVRFSPTDFRKLKALAKKLRVTVSAVIRLNVYEALDKGGEDTNE